MGIHDRDWYREERKQERAQPRHRSRSNAQKPVDPPPEPKAAPYVSRRQAGSLPHVRYTPIGFPRWFMALVLAVALVALVALFQAVLKR